MNPFNELSNRIRERFSLPPRPELSDNDFFTDMPPASQRDRTLPAFRSIIEDSLQCWRNDPLARRIVNLTTEFSIGSGLSIQAGGMNEQAFIGRFWNHELNHMDARIREWSDELCRTGNLFIVLSSDISGMTYVRAIPAAQIEEIIPRQNDIEQPEAFRVREVGTPNEVTIPRIDLIPAAALIEPTFEPRILHFTVNRPVGGQWGEPDLAPLLTWLHRYDCWLEDRCRLNHYRNCFLYVVKCGHISEQGRLARQQQLNRRPPTAGSILVTGAEEEWTTISSQLESGDANEDGLAIKKMIAAGAGIPLQYLSEPGASSRADSEGMQDSAIRGFEQRQQLFEWITETLLRHVLARRFLADPSVHPDVPLHVEAKTAVRIGEAE